MDKLITWFANLAPWMWLIPLVVTTFLAVAGLRFKDRLEKRASNRDDIRLIIDAATAESFKPEGLRELCLEKALGQFFNVDIPIDVLNCVLKNPAPSLAFREFKNHQSLLVFNPDEKMFYKRMPVLCSKLFKFISYFVWRSPVSIQYGAMALNALIFFFAGSSLLGEALDQQTSGNFHFAALFYLIAVPCALFGFIMFARTWLIFLEQQFAFNYIGHLPFINDNYEIYLPRWLE